MISGTHILQLLSFPPTEPYLRVAVVFVEYLVGSSLHMFQLFLPPHPQGFISGFAKGMVGTVTKPAIGLLDLASSTSLAVRDSSKKYVSVCGSLT